MTAGALRVLIAHDARLQWRYGIYAAYGFVVAIYIGMLLGAGRYLPAWVVGTIVFTDPAAVGFFFLGGLLMLERAERVRAPLAVTPMAPGAYLASKAVTLTVLACASSAILLPFFHSGANPALLLTSVALTSLQYVGIGMPIGLRFKTVSGYIIGSAGFLTPVIAPGFLALIEPTPVWLYVIPAVSQLKLMLVATGAATAPPAEIAVMLAVAAAAATGALWLAYRSVTREFAGR